MCILRTSRFNEILTAKVATTQHTDIQSLNSSRSPNFIKNRMSDSKFKVVPSPLSTHFKQYVEIPNVKRYLEKKQQKIDDGEMETPPADYHDRDSISGYYTSIATPSERETDHQSECSAQFEPAPEPEQDETPEYDKQYQADAEESTMRMWRHDSFVYGQAIAKFARDRQMAFDKVYEAMRNSPDKKVREYAHKVRERQHDTRSAGIFPRQQHREAPSTVKIGRVRKQPSQEPTNRLPPGWQPGISWSRCPKRCRRTNLVW